MITVIPSGYDPILMNHWLWFKHQCHECSPADFQRLFENIIKRVDTKFVQIRPYGNIGDRKCDGLFFCDMVPTTVYQVYSPDELTQKEVQDKIDEDLDGAYKHWAELKDWIFVYNSRRGLAPDIPRTLAQKQKEYPSVSLNHLSNDSLWEMIRGLPLQQRSEILGAPSGYEHLFFNPNTSPEEIREHLKTDSFVLVQDLLSPISLQAVSEALAPAQPFGAPFFIRPTYSKNSFPWTDAARQQKQMVGEIITKGRELLPRFSVFSLAPIPLIIHLGFLLSNRVEVNCFQFDRNIATWKWPEEPNPDLSFQISGLPDAESDEPQEIAISVSLSGKVSKADIKEAAPDVGPIINISIQRPDVMWLRSPLQLAELKKIFGEVLTSVRNNFPNRSKIHIFYAGPVGGAIVIGQQINPRMDAPVELYEYSRDTSPRYTHALTLREELS